MRLQCPTIPANFPVKASSAGSVARSVTLKKAAQTDVESPGPKTIFREQHVQEEPLPHDPSIKLRRTTIDEVIVEPPPANRPANAGQSQSPE